MLCTSLRVLVPQRNCYIIKRISALDTYFKQYLIDFLRYNEEANIKLLASIQKLPEQEESVRLFSHCIAAQNKWMNRITKEKSDSEYQWSAQSYLLNELETKWKESIGQWIRLLEQREEASLNKSIEFTRQTDGKKFGAALKDIVLQINYHCIHHRAQINRIIRQQGLTPPATDYILSALKEL